MRSFIALFIALIIGMGSFGFQSVASGPMEGALCFPNATPHSPFGCPEITNPVFIGYNDTLREVYFARIASSTKPGLTPMYNVVEIVGQSMDNDLSAVIGRLELRYQFSPRLHSISLIGQFVAVFGEINQGRDGFLLLDVSNRAKPKLAGGRQVGTSYQAGEWSYMSSFLSSEGRLIVAVSHAKETTVIPHRSELIVFTIDWDGKTTERSVFQIADRIDIVDAMWTGDFMLLTTDSNGKKHRAYLTPSFELIGYR